jgi:hypothetical protein
MSIIEWFIIVVVIIIGLIGGYFQLMIFANLRKKNTANILFGSWVFNPDNLNEQGKFYRKAIFVCWLLGIALVVFILNSGIE